MDESGMNLAVIHTITIRNFKPLRCLLAAVMKVTGSSWYSAKKPGHLPNLYQLSKNRKVNLSRQCWRPVCEKCQAVMCISSFDNFLSQYDRFCCIIRPLMLMCTFLYYSYYVRSYILYIICYTVSTDKNLAIMHDGIFFKKTLVSFMFRSIKQ